MKASESYSQRMTPETRAQLDDLGEVLRMPRSMVVNALINRAHMQLQQKRQEASEPDQG